MYEWVVLRQSTWKKKFMDFHEDSQPGNPYELNPYQPSYELNPYQLNYVTSYEWVDKELSEYNSFV